MRKTTNLVLGGLSPNEIRRELHEYFAERKGSGVVDTRGDTSRSQIVNMLMRIWVSPDPVLRPFRDAAVAFFHEQPSEDVCIHWAMTSAVYPFWFNAARHTGRLLSLQDGVTQQQIVNRLKEDYGDRQTVSRYGRYAIRSFVYWGVLRDSESHASYVASPRVEVREPKTALLMIEGALHANREGKGALNSLLNDPGFFAFCLPVLSGDVISRSNDRLEVNRYGLDDQLVGLRE